MFQSRCGGLARRGSAFSSSFQGGKRGNVFPESNRYVGVCNGSMQHSATQFEATDRASGNFTDESACLAALWTLGAERLDWLARGDASSQLFAQGVAKMYGAAAKKVCRSFGSWKDLGSGLDRFQKNIPSRHQRGNLPHFG